MIKTLKEINVSEKIIIPINTEKKDDNSLG
jgi:hypothetical protein